MPQRRGVCRFFFGVLFLCFFSQTAAIHSNRSSTRVAYSTPSSSSSSRFTIQSNFQYVVHRLLENSILSSLANDSRNPECKRQAERTLHAAQHFDLWALKVADASAKIPSGLLQGNVHQFGDYDECLSINSDSRGDSPDSDSAVDGAVASHYCLAAVDLQTIPFPRIGKLIRSLDVFRSNLSDPGHRVPRLSAALVGMCVPKTCDPESVANALRSSLSPLSVAVRVDDDLCRDEERTRFGPSFWFAVGIFGLILLCSILSTAVDLYFPDLFIHNEKAVAALMAFSVIRNWRKLIATDAPKGDIACLHGVRAIHVFALLLSHKSVAILFSPYTNRTQLAEIIGGSWSILGRAAILYTDTFILISGLLTSQSLFRELNRSGRVQLVKRALSRYMRLTPVLIALILWCTLILPKLSSGPLWGMVIDRHAKLCKQYWWRNLLYVHNYFGFQNMCLTYTHQLGIDMQLFLFAPALVIPLWYYPRMSLGIMTFLAVLSTILRYTVTINNNLSSLVYFGVSVSQMFDTANLSYILPTHRASVYICGLLLGWTLWRLPRNYKLPITSSIFGWAFFGLLGIYALVGSYESGRPDFKYDVRKAANYAAFAPIMWSVFLSWGIIACVHGAGSILNDLLSWRWFIVITRIAYSVYLTQFPVFFFNIGIRRYSSAYNIFELLNIPEFAFIIVVSCLLTLLVELPFQELSNIALKNHGVKQTKNS